ncbi:MAG TPA: diacylglycerol kinase family protein [Anaerolineales bacterium]
MPKTNVKLIINPNADIGRAWRWASDLRPIVEEYGGADWSGTVYPTHATELARQAAEQGYEMVVAVGGDGTVHEIINGLMDFPPERRPRLGVVPMGSGNDFAHNTGINSRPEIAMRQVFTGELRKIDLGVIKDEHGRLEYWGNTLGIGFDATVTIRSHSLPVLRGFLMYLTAVIQTIMVNYDAPRMQIKTDQEQWEEAMLMIVLCNGQREGGGFYVAPEAENNDGWFNYAAIRKVSRPMMFRLIPEVMRGTHGRFPQVRMGKFRELQLKSEDPLHVHVDGEIFAGFGTDLRELSVSILPQEIEVMV